MVIFTGMITAKPGQRDAYVKALKDSGVIEKFRSQEGNVFYQIAPSGIDDDVMIVTDGWDDVATFTAHDTSDLVKEIWWPLYNQYAEKFDTYLMKDVTPEQI